MTDVLVIPEHRRGEVRSISYQLLSCGAKLAHAGDGTLHVGLISGPVEDFATKLNRDGVDFIHTVAAGEEFNHDLYRATTSALIDRHDPDIVLAPHSVNGMDFAPTVAMDHDLALVTDAIGIETGDGLSVIREMYGSKVETTIDVEADTAVITIREGAWPALEDDGEAVIEPADIDVDPDQTGARVTGYEEMAGGDVDITDADVLVSVGRGIGEEENLELIEDLAAALDATVSASRPIVDAGWLPQNRQVGQSGKTVSPDVYIAIGISGAVQHVAGMQGADTIVAINTDPDAPIFDIADYGIVDDLFEVVPTLIDAVNE